MINPVRNAVAPFFVNFVELHDVEDVHLWGKQSNVTGLHSVIGLHTVITDKTKIGSVSPE